MKDHKNNKEIALEIALSDYEKNGSPLPKWAVKMMTRKIIRSMQRAKRVEKRRKRDKIAKKSLKTNRYLNRRRK